MHQRQDIKFLLIIMVLLLTMSMLSGCLFKKEKPTEEGKDIVEEPKEQNQPQERQTPAEVPKDGSETEEKTGVFVGDKAYDFTLLDREGNEISLSSLQGKVVFMNFWASWCPPCVQEMPYIQAIYDQYQKKDVVILAVNVLATEKGKDAAAVNQFLSDNGYTFPVLYDVDGSVTVKYRVSAFPATYIIDKDGYIADFISGAMNKDTMEKKIEKVLNP
ncbi:Peroxiredoxin [Geosporobacter subterraneus DSM 17957]|uniref:Peroxiredoxin n=2 Tax=Geosporobacter TaxID=390805 RepID=A0A1M6PS86_9FIRM|nr:Peroxiredoxin [Geosporobacter subterraneus DSM 17957]